MRLPLSIALLAFAPLGCSVYQHQVDIRVLDPHRVWVETGRAAARTDPSGPDSGASIPGTHDRAAWDADGVLRVAGQKLVGSDGTLVSPPATLDKTSLDAGVFRIPACYRDGRRGVGCKRSLMLATPWDNVVMAREADVPPAWVGWLEILGGAGVGALGAVAARGSYDSGGALLIGTGAVAVIAGIVQLYQPVKGERDMLP